MPSYDDKNFVFETLTESLESAFREAVGNGRIIQFAKRFDTIANAMISELPSSTLIPKVLHYAFRRLVSHYFFLRQRRTAREFLQGESLVVKWAVDPGLLAAAIDQVETMQQTGSSHQEFRTRSSPDLHRWIFDHYWPIVAQFSGMAALPVVNAHLRCYSADKNGSDYASRFQFHRFGNHHLDQDPYSLPLIIYLGDVGPDNGPFEYLAESERYSQNGVLRALHQAMNHDCGLSSLDERNFPAIAGMPSVFRGGDVFGNLYPEAAFERASPVSVTGDIGTAIMFHGFSVIHAGGLPKLNCRKALFVNFRFPVAKLLPGVWSAILGRRWFRRSKLLHN